MEHIVVGLVIILAGLLLIIFRKKFVNDIVKLNNNGLGIYKYSKGEEQFGLLFTVFFGAIAICLGIAILVGMLKLK